MQSQNEPKFPFYVVDKFKIKSNIKLQLLAFSYEKEDYNNLDEEFMPDIVGRQRQSESELLLNLIYWKKSSLYLYFRDLKGGKISFEGVKVQLLGLSPSGRYVLGMKSKGDVLYFIDQKDRAMEEYDLKTPIPANLKTKVICVTETAKLILVYDYEGKGTLYGISNYDGKHCSQFTLSIDTEPHLKPIINPNPKFVEQLYTKICPNPQRFTAVCVAVPRLHRESKFCILQVFKDSQRNGLVLLLVEIDVTDSSARPVKRRIEKELAIKDEPELYKKVKQVQIRTESVDNEMAAVYVEGELSGYLFIVSLVLIDKPVTCFPLDSALQSIETFSFINLNPLTFAAMTKQDELVVFVLKNGCQVMQRTPLRSFSMSRNASNDYVHMSQEPFNTIGTKKAVLLAVDSQVLIFAVDFENLRIVPSSSNAAKAAMAQSNYIVPLPMSSAPMSIYQPRSLETSSRVSQVVESLWLLKRLRNAPAKPEEVFACLNKFNESLLNQEKLLGSAVIPCKEQVVVSLYMLAQRLAHSGGSQDRSLYQHVFTLYDRLRKALPSPPSFNSTNTRISYKKEEILMFQELMSYISLKKLDLSSVFKLLRDKIWELPAESKIKPFAFFVIFDVLRQIWAATLSSTSDNCYYKAIPYLACGDLYHLVVIKDNSTNLIARYHDLCVKQFHFEAKRSKDSLGMPHFQGYNLFKCLMFLLYLLRLRSELLILSQATLQASLLTSPEKLQAYLLLISLTFEQESANNPSAEQIRKLFLPLSKHNKDNTALTEAYGLWLGFERVSDESLLDTSAFLNDFVSIPLLIKLESEELFLEYFLETYISECHIALKALVRYYNTQQLWSKLSACLFSQLGTNDSMFFTFLEHYSQILQAEQEKVKNIQFDVAEAKSFQYLIKILLTFPLCPEYPVQSLLNSKSSTDKKIYKILRLVFYILTRVIEPALDRGNLGSILTCQLTYLFYEEFDKPHLVLQSVLDHVDRNAQSAEDLSTNTPFLIRIKPTLLHFADLINSQPRYKILQFYTKNSQNKAEGLQLRDWSEQLSTVRNIKAKLFTDFIEFLQGIPNPRKNNFSKLILTRHLDQLKRVKALRDQILSKFYQMFRLSY